MGDKPVLREGDPASHRPAPEPSRGSGVIFVVVVLALILAIGFFYMTNDRRENRQADAITGAAGSVDNAARVIGDAAKNAADELRNDN